MMRVILLCLSVTAAAVGQTGQIKGTVVDETGAPIQGATVRANLRRAAERIPTGPPRPPAFMPVPAKAPSGARGEFEIDSLYAGNYLICADVPDKAYLDPCLWSDEPTTLDVAAGGKTTGVRVVAQKGVVVTVRIDDPKGLLRKNPAGDDVLVGTYHGNSPFIFGRVTGHDATGKLIGVVTIPGQPVTVYVSSANFALADGAGKVMSASAQTQFTLPGVASSNGSPALTVRVTGGIVKQ